MSEDKLFTPIDDESVEYTYSNYQLLGTTITPTFSKKLKPNTYQLHKQYLEQNWTSWNTFNEPTQSAQAKQIEEEVQEVDFNE